MRLDPDVHAIWRVHHAAPAAWTALVVYNIALGAVLLMGGPYRVDGPSYSVIRDYGGPQAWGAVYVALGLALAAAAVAGPTATAAIYRLTGLMHLLLAASFIGAVIVQERLPGEPHAALTGIPTYLFVATIHFVCARAYRAPRTTVERGASA